MTPNDLDAYLKVLSSNQVGSAALKLPGGVEVHVSFTPQFPVQVGDQPTPGGWKSPVHLDNPNDLRESDYPGSLPS